MSSLSFIYRNAAGTTSQRVVSQWQEIGHYIKGFSEGDGAIRSFRKDRIVQYLEACDAKLVIPFSAPPPKPSREKHIDERPQILFTGFAKVQRATLEARSVSAGLRVCQSVTTQLAYLCCGPNAGPAKVEKARQQRVFVLSEAELHLLLETGELPDLEDIAY